MSLMVIDGKFQSFTTSQNVLLTDTLMDEIIFKGTDVRQIEEPERSTLFTKMLFLAKSNHNGSNNTKPVGRFFKWTSLCRNVVDWAFDGIFRAKSS